MNVKIIFTLFCFGLIACSIGITYHRPYGNQLVAPDTIDRRGRYFCGNTHAHTTNSDGDSGPEEVARWYQKNRYNFLVITDHNKVTKLSELNTDSFIVIPGEELTVRAARIPVHVNALNLRHTIRPYKSRTVLNVLQSNINAIRDMGAVPHVNHPNWQRALSEEDLYRVSNYNLFEIFNGSPDANNEGLVTVWDHLLSRGKLVYGIATDDAHHFKQWGPKYSNPGRGWVCVESQHLNANEIVHNLDMGNFYASTGPRIERIQVWNNNITIHSDGVLTLFYGSGGKLLHKTTKQPAQFQLVTMEQYVRAEVIDVYSRVAWTQPVFTRRR